MTYLAKPKLHHPTLPKNKVGYTRRDYEGKISTLCAGCGHDSISAAIVQAITTLGQTIGLTVTAEGVETEEQRSFLATSGCTELQGYLFARALPEDKIASVIKGNRPT